MTATRPSALGRLGTAALCLLLAGAGAVAWWLQLQPPMRVDPSGLLGLPAEIGDWQGQDIPLEDQVEAELRADFNLQRVYRHRTGEIVWLYLGYYGTSRGGRPEHTPRGCYTGAGWTVERVRTLDVDPASGLRVNEFLVERDGDRRVVHFWYRSHLRTGILGGLDQNLDRLEGRLFHGRADGALVRLSTVTDGSDDVAARSRLLAFARVLDPLLAERWPEETRANGHRRG
jgi:EpsI family protein